MTWIFLSPARLQDDVELGLFLGFVAACTATGGGHGNGGGGSSADTPLILEGLNELRRLQKGQAVELIGDGLELSVELDGRGLFGHG